VDALGDTFQKTEREEYWKEQGKQQK